MLIGGFMLYLFFWQLPIFAGERWPETFEHKTLIQATATTGMFLACAVVSTLLYLPGYLGWKGYKKYEVPSTLPKPWEKPNWPEMRMSTIKNLCLIYFVLNPLYFTLGAFLGTMKF
jgi:hypothetical protein